MNGVIRKSYNEKEIDFKTRLNGNINPDFVKGLLIEVYGGCESGINPIKVFEYFLGDEALMKGKGETVKGIVCDESLKGRTSVLCKECKFYVEEGRAPIYEYKEVSQKKEEK